MCDFSANVAFDKATNGQTGIKHEMGKTFSSMSLLKIVGEKLPPSQSDSVSVSVSVILVRPPIRLSSRLTLTLKIKNKDNDILIMTIWIDAFMSISPNQFKASQG